MANLLLYRKVELPEGCRVGEVMLEQDCGRTPPGGNEVARKQQIRDRWGIP